MSKYKYEMYVCVGSSIRSKVVDLVDDWGYEESDLDGRTEEDIVIEVEESCIEGFVWDHVDCGVKRIDG